jgi:hypothetical protein
VLICLESRRGGNSSAQYFRLFLASLLSAGVPRRKLLMPWERMLVYATGEIDEQLLARIQYLIEENRILRNQISKRILLSSSCKTIKTECLDHLILFGEKSLRHVVKEYLAHYHTERNHQGIENVIPFPAERLQNGGDVITSERLGGLLNFYYRDTA